MSHFRMDSNQRWKHYFFIMIAGQSISVIGRHWAPRRILCSRMHWNTNMVPYIGNYNSFCRSA